MPQPLSLTKGKILILDGAFGTMAQSYKLPESDYLLNGRLAKGCNDVLCLTRPEIVAEIHQKYIDAGADIIETNSFNANPISLSDYGLEHRAYDIAKASAQIAKSLSPLLVAGSMGPTNRSLSISPDVNRPDYREVSFDQLRDAYRIQAQGLIDGGADLLLIETTFDTLNAKAAVSAIRDISADIPIMISGTLSDASGRTLSGQTVEAFWVSVRHAHPSSIGLNCGFGAKHLLPYLRRLSAIADCCVSVHPNAGLPNVMGAYDETPESFADQLEKYFKEGIVNIAGGCCGTTPEHITAMAQRAAKYQPRLVPESQTTDMMLSGLEPLRICREANFINIGERTNVAGSAKFAKLIRQGEYAQAIDVARDQVNAGAQIIDICMDDALIDGPSAMSQFINLIASEPEIARVPLMIDSSHWPTVEAGLKCTQGKSIVNSISLKEGEATFLQRAKAIMGYGAAAVVMLFDEQGQADTYQRKIDVAKRAYDLLMSIDFPKEDIIIDPNILAIATGIPAHDRFALDFIEATRWIKNNLPGAKISGGVSNLSFAFRGNNDVRKAMHSVFLYHAIAAGMDMAIVNPQMTILYDDIEPELLQRVEDAILYTRPDAADRLAEIAQEISARAEAAKDNPQSAHIATETPNIGVEQRISNAMLKGDSSAIASDAVEAIASKGSAIGVINDLLMPAMERVGSLFAEGKLFLPQVVKSARVMKTAVDALRPHIEAEGKGVTAQSKAKVVLATVKGDVHDIGKNIVAVVLACNGYDVCDMGVMVEPEAIVAKAREVNAVAIGLSGLITPSLTEMMNVAQESERQGLLTPIIIGGATTTLLHTALKIAPVTSAPVIHARDAADTARIVNALASSARDEFLEQNRKAQADAISKHNQGRNTSSPAVVKHIDRKDESSAEIATPNLDLSLEDVVSAIDWVYFFAAWGMPGKVPEIFSHPQRGEEAKKLYHDAQAMLRRIVADNALELRGKFMSFPAEVDGDNIVLQAPDGNTHVLPMLRSQNGECIADFVDGQASLFVLSAGFGLEMLRQKYEQDGDDYSAIMAKLLADRLTEAYAQAAMPAGCRFAFGYPSVPDHSLKRSAFELLDAQSLGFSLTDNCMIVPGESICGIWLPRGHYFTLGQISDQKLEDYAIRRGIPIEEIKKYIRQNERS